MERIWGGRRLESEFGKKLPAQKRIGESWEIVDRPEAQSVVVNGLLRGKTVHDVWTQDRSEIFGDLPDASRFQAHSILRCAASILVKGMR
jgi:mannose-6-phosphate isomerase